MRLDAYIKEEKDDSVREKGSASRGKVRCQLEFRSGKMGRSVWVIDGRNEEIGDRIDRSRITTQY